MIYTTTCLYLIRNMNRKMQWDDKKDWVKKRKDLYMKIATSTSISPISRQRVFDFSKGLWETPKVFVDGYAYNDGTWLLYNTYRVKNGKFHNKVLCKTKKEIIEQVYSYLCFLKMIGVSNTLEMGYFSVCHIVWKLTFPKGLFKPNMTNLSKLEKLTKTVMKNDVVCARKDPRQYCIDPKIKRGKTRGQITGLQRKKDKDIRWKRIGELYDPSLTNNQNLDKMRDNGLNISEATLHRWKRVCQMVIDNHKTTNNSG